MDVNHPSYTTVVKHPAGGYEAVLRVWSVTTDDYMTVESKHYTRKPEARMQATIWAVRRRIEVKLT